MLRDLFYSMCVAFAGFLFVWFYTEPLEQDHEAQTAQCESKGKIYLARGTDERNSSACERTDLFGLIKQAASIWTSPKEPSEFADAPSRQFKPTINDTKAAKIVVPETATITPVPVLEPRPKLSVARQAPADWPQKTGSKSDRPTSTQTADQSTKPSGRRIQGVRPRQKPDFPLFAGLGGALSEIEIGQVTAIESPSTGRGSVGVDATLSYDIISRRFEAPLAGNQEQAMIPVQFAPVDLSVLGNLDAVSPGELSLSNTTTNN